MTRNRRTLERLVPGRNLLVFGFLLLLLASGQNAIAGAEKPRPAYHQKVRFSQGVPLSFPDLTLTFQGKRHVPSKEFPRGFTYFDFVAESNGEKIPVSWSSGTGVIDPVRFQLGGKTYSLELRGSDTLGWLKEDELVLGPVRPQT